MRGRNLISTLDFTREEQDGILDLASHMQADTSEYSHLLDARVLASLFFEPSTRTRLSFEAAMLRLGGRVVGFSEQASSSTSKGESLSDTIRVCSQYADILTIRHPKEGSALIAAEVAGIPVINAGDGGREHPTQTLTDLLAIRSRRGELEGLVVGCCGDLKFGRTVHSLVKNISRYPGVRFVFVSPAELVIPQYLRSWLDEQGVPYEETADMEEALRGLDVLYMTRVQRERFFNEADYIRLKDLYILDASRLRHAREELLILHPLPRVNEIAPEVDADPRAVYFEQVKCGMYVRMALIARLLGAV